jgi:hypothetical protein
MRNLGIYCAVHSIYRNLGLQILNVNLIHFSVLRLVNTCNFCWDFRCDFLLLMDVNEWMSYECSDEGSCTQNIHNPSTRSHASEEENRNKNCKCKQAFTVDLSRSTVAISPGIEVCWKSTIVYSRPKNRPLHLLYLPSWVILTSRFSGSRILSQISLQSRTTVWRMIKTQ